MNNRKIAFLWLGLMIGCALWAEETSLPPEGTRQRAYVDAAMEQIRGKHIRIEGQVVDPNGQPVPNVTLDIMKRKLIMFYDYTADTEDKVLPDGRFSFDFVGYTNVYLSCRKRGYFVSSTHSYKLGEGKTQQEKQDLVRYSSENIDQVITLEPIGEIARTEFEDLIWQKLPLDEINHIVLNFDTLEVIDLRKEPVPQKYIEVIQGEVNPEANRRQPPHHYSIKLHSDDPADGFVAISDVKSLRALIEAPVDGYTLKEIPLQFTTSNDIRRFFYFRRGNQYGKMCLFETSCNRPKTHLQLRFYIIVNTEENPDMKRRLRSDSDKMY